MRTTPAGSPPSPRTRRWAIIGGLTLLAVSGAAGGAAPAPLAVLPGGAGAAAQALQRAGLQPTVDRRGRTDALLLGTLGVPREALALVSNGTGAGTLYAAALRHSAGPGAAAVEAGPRPVLGGPGLAVADVAPAGPDLAVALGSGGQVSAVRIQRGLGATVALFALSPPAPTLSLRADPSHPSGVAVQWPLTGGGTGRAVLYRVGPGLWRSTSPRLQVQAAPVARHNPFIFVVEWVRNTFGGRPVALAEDTWYGLTDLVRRHLYALAHPRAAASAPPSPAPAAAPRTPAPGPHLPARLPVPVGYPQAPGEGVWVPVGPRVGGQAVMAQTFLLPDASRPYERVDLVWLDLHLLHIHLVAGTAHPLAASGIHGPGVIPPAARSRLVAAFNGGFKKYDGQFGNFGYRAAGVWYRTPVAGLATLAVYPNGGVRLGAWGSQLPATPTPWGLLQNLTPLVEHGRVAPTITQGAQWGVTVGNSVRVWRSGLAQTAGGNLIYAAGVPVTADTLARAFALAGARNAMQLDINSYWVTFNYYQPTAPGAETVTATKLMPTMVRPATRYLTPDRRDFIYVTLPRA